jgi:hypothetical protein
MNKMLGRSAFVGGSAANNTTGDSTNKLRIVKSKNCFIVVVPVARFLPVWWW